MANDADVNDQTKSGGYDVEFVKDHVSELDLKCSICLMVLRAPMQAIQCGHRFCKSCIELEKQRQNTEKLSCPIDRDEITIFLDKGKQREILGFEVKCTNKGESKCNWIGELKNFEEHREQCLYEVIDCEKHCGVKQILRKDGKSKELEMHVETSASQHLTFQIEDQNKRLSTLEEDLKREKEENEKLKAKIRKIENDSITERHDNVRIKAKVRTFEKNYARKCPYTFKVTNFSSKRKKGEHVYSDIFEFFNGYRAKLKVTFNNDGKSIGLFFALVAGSCDDILQWPVVFSEISMKCFMNGKCFQDMSFKHREGVTNFLKPQPKVIESNVGRGFPKFLKEENIPDDLHNDEIQFIVDITEKE